MVEVVGVEEALQVKVTLHVTLGMCNHFCYLKNLRGEKKNVCSWPRGGKSWKKYSQVWESNHMVSKLTVPLWLANGEGLLIMKKQYFPVPLHMPSGVID